MFVGHYAAGYAIKKRFQDIPLWLIFIAVQFVDILARTLHEGGRQDNRIFYDNNTLFSLSTYEVRLHSVPIQFHSKSRYASYTIPLEP
jgi:hypothetical protein